MEEVTTGVLNLTDETGHTAVKWNRSSKESCDRARMAFDSAVATKTRVAFRTAPDPAKITEFDPNAEDITIVNAYQGG